MLTKRLIVKNSKGLIVRLVINVDCPIYNYCYLMNMLCVETRK